MKCSLGMNYLIMINVNVNTFSFCLRQVNLIIRVINMVRNRGQSLNKYACLYEKSTGQK